MLAVRLYYDYKTDKLVSVRLVNERTAQFQDYNISSIKSMLSYGDVPISNLTIDKYGRVKLINMNPKTNRFAYRETFIGNMKIKHYCILTGTQQGLLSVIADTPHSNIAYGNNLTLAQISELLEIRIDDIKFYNGYIENVNGRYNVYVYSGNKRYTLVQQKVNNPLTKFFGENWDLSVNKEKSTRAGVSLDYLYNIIGEYESSIPEGVINIDKFIGGVEILHLPNTLQSLGSGCFKGISGIKAVTFGKGLKTIPKSCFEQSSIENVQFSGYEDTIDEDAFHDCQKLWCTINSNAYNIKARAFFNTRISGLVLPEAREIGVEAFAKNDRLTRVRLGNKLEVIGAGAFRYCKSLETIMLPKSLKSIRKLAFDGCSKLRVIQMSADTMVVPGAIPNNVVVRYYDVGVNKNI